MEKLECDVLVVGAGPAGTSAARAAASRGARVLVVERRAVIGCPVQCAEYIPAALLGEAGVGRRFVVQSIRGMRTFLNGRCIQETTAPGYTIRRDLFDQALGEAAKRAGASIMTEWSAIARECDEVLLSHETVGQKMIGAKVIIGADGPHSRVSQWIGSGNSRLIPGVQVRMRLVRPMEFTEVFFDSRFFGGYGWLFPKGFTANIGLGMINREVKAPKIRQMLDEFVSELVRDGKIKGRPLHFAAGWIPVRASKRIAHGNMLLAGDAAGHTHPITGAGIFHAVVGGRMAGEWAARAISEDNMDLLVNYETEWNELFGETFDLGLERRRLLEQEWDRLEEIIQTCWVTFREYYAASGRHFEAGEARVVA